MTPRRRISTPPCCSQALCLAALACTLWFASGCGMSEHRKQLRSLHRVGDYHQAAALMDDPDIKKGYGSRDQLLWELDRGALALALDDYATTIEVLEQAEQYMDARLGESFSDTLARWTLSDAETAYTPQLHETIYINVLKLLANLESGKIQGGATVEARRLSRKADQLRELHVTYNEQLQSEAPDAADAAADAAKKGWIGSNKQDEFIESTLGTYLTAVTFMETGNTDFQRVAGKRLQDSIALQEGFIGDVNPDAFAGLGEMNPDDADVLVVAFSGRGPTKHPQRIGPILIATAPIYFELPVLDITPSSVEHIWAEVEGGSRYELNLVEDLNQVAAANLERDLPSIYTRTYIRAAAKAALTVAAAEAARRQARDSNQVWAQVAVAVGGLILVTATETADLRSWVFLPGRANVALLDLPPGPHRIRVVYEDRRGGTVYTTPWRDIESRDKGLATIVEHYWD